ncbi:polysaccharide biosynthesis tyrosine autokinase [Paludisphaera rhizosphaerae]|uniref:polysaccharide biosynthesis tyrosine autokinase n=1 Tax=Paludisphaera rhizosphaerae TaxID=2711216 RepID=UPI0013EB2698|nr:polysaccharide biosynthesis tyrosine autokinase [Paludisphaera rhizosphaerae]
MDDIAPYRRASASIAPAGHGAAAPAPAGFPAHAPATFGGTPYGPDLAAVKTTGHYVSALRRRFWLALLIAVPMGTMTSIYALRLPKVYQATGTIRIQQPHNDPSLQTVLSNGPGSSDAAVQATYAADMITDLKGRGLAERALTHRQWGPEVAQMDDPATELIVKNITVTPVMRSNSYHVTLTGRDPAQTAKLLEALLDELVNYAKHDQTRHKEEVVANARAGLNALQNEARSKHGEMIKSIETLGTIGPGGRNILEEQYAHLGQSIELQQARAAELQQKMLFAPLFGQEEHVSPAEVANQQKLERLQEEREVLVERLKAIKKGSRNFNGDLAARNLASHLDEVLNRIDRLSAPIEKTKMAADPTEMIYNSLQSDIDAAEGQRVDLLEKLRKAMPDHQKFLSLMEDRDALRIRIGEMEDKLSAFELLANSQEPPVKVLTRIEEQPTPIKPNRPMMIVMGLLASLGLGLGLVFLLEHLDHSVRVPEHVSHGLSLPLLGVVPRIARTALTHRAGHLWTSAVPDSLAADAFRNIRASLLGAADRNGPIVSLLVTSAKAGDGKSTAAINLAAACARAGERTLLLDVDLRRPTLADVFPADDPESEGLGLVDVLKGAVPWQATLRHTDLHNLDFIATGDTTDVPIEILGTLELRQLLTALTHNYDRVILDGPAILGMADCRVLGRMVDASVLVVRAGAHQTMTLQRAKAVLEQSHVEIAGVIVNGLSEGVEHWSSYGYGPAPISASSQRRERALPGAAASPSREEALAEA